VIRGVTLLLAAAVLPSCGYHLVRPDVGAGRTVLVPVPVNDTGWHGIEADLASGLRADMQRQLDVRLSADAPDLVLNTEIADATRGERVGRRGGGAALGTARLRVDWHLLDASGTELVGGSILRELEFVTTVGEDPYATFPGILAEISEQIVLEVGARLAADAPTS